MFEPKTPYEVFSPIHPAYLRYLLKNDRDVTAAHLDSIECHFPNAMMDPLFAEHRARSNAGKLYLKRGRKPQSINRGMLWMIFFAIEEERERIWAERRNKSRTRLRGGASPGIEAAQTVADRLRLNCTGEALLNRLARERIPKNF